MRYLKFLTIFAIWTIIFSAGENFAQPATTVITGGLRAPNKIVTAGQSSLFVSEAGTMMPNNGRVSMVDRMNGARVTLIDGLPSGINTAEGQPAPAGPSGLKLNGLTLYVTIGAGDSVIPGGRGGLAANASPVTPLNNSVLKLTLPADYEQLTSGFSLSFADQTTLAEGGQVNLMNAQGKTLAVRMVTNLPDWKLQHNPELPQYNVRPANVFGIEVFGSDLYVVDASFNQLYKVNPATGKYEDFTVFAPKPNPLPFGPPFAEAVPDSVRLYGNRLLVTYLTGFPFASGLAEVRSVNLIDGSQQTFVDGLTTAIDVLPVPVAGNHDVFYILEFSANMLGQPPAPGRLKLYQASSENLGTSQTITLLDNIVSPTSIARDNETGDLFITQIFPGIIRKVSATIDQSTQISDGQEK